MIKNMKQILATIIIIAALFLSAPLIFPVYAQETTAPPLVPPKGDFSAMRKSGISTVIKVINPMTIKLKDDRIITLTGLDYPDLDFYDPGELSVTAQKVLEDFLTGKRVIIYQTTKSDRGRINRMGYHIAHLARIDEDKLKDKDKAVWVEGLMLSLGLARVRTTKYNNQMAAQMLKLEDEARRLKLGLWDMKDYAVLTPKQAAKKVGSYQIVKGTIKNISRHKNNIYINFGHNWREDFTLGISSATLRGFSRKHIYPSKWNGMEIRVHGWIESYNGPFIEINHPESIELLSTELLGKSLKTGQQTKPNDTPITFEGSALPQYNK